MLVNYRKIYFENKIQKLYYKNKTVWAIVEPINNRKPEINEIKTEQNRNELTQKFIFCFAE